MFSWLDNNFSLFTIQFFILRNTHTNCVQYLFGCHALGFVVDFKYAATFQDEVFQLFFVDRHFGFFGGRQAFVGQLGQLQTVRAKCFVEIEEF